MKFVGFILILIFTLNLNASLFDKNKEIVTNPYFYKDKNNLYSLFGVEDKNNNVSYIIKFDIKQNEIDTIKELDNSKLNIIGNIQAIEYQNQEAYIIFLSKQYLNKIVIFDRNLNILYAKDIYSSSSIKNSGVVADINGDSLLDIILQTNEYLYVLINNKDRFKENKLSLKDEYLDDKYFLYTKVAKPYILDRGKNKTIILYFTQKNEDNNFKKSFIKLYSFIKNSYSEELKLFDSKGHISNLDIKKIDSKIYFSFPLIDNSFKSGEVIVNKNIEFNTTNDFKIESFAKNNIKYSHKIVNFQNKPYYLILDKKTTLTIMDLENNQISKKIDKYTPKSIELSLILNKNSDSYDTYINNKTDNGINFISPINQINQNINIEHTFNDKSLKHIFATENNTTYLLGFNQKTIISKKIDNKSIKFAPFKNYNNLLNEVNYIATKDTLKYIILNISNTNKKQLNFLYRVTNNEFFYELYKKLDNIKLILNYTKINNIDEKLYNYFLTQFKNDKDNFIFNSIFLDDIFLSLNHSFNNYKKNLNILDELNILIDDKRVKKLKNLYESCNKTFELYKKLSIDDKIKIDNKFREMMNSFENLNIKKCEELQNEVNSIIMFKRLLTTVIPIIIVLVILILYIKKFQIKILYINIKYRKNPTKYFNKFYLLDIENLIDFLSFQDIKESSIDNYKKLNEIEDRYFDAVSKLKLNNRLTYYFIDTFYNALVIHFNNESYTKDWNLKIENDNSYKFALKKLKKLSNIKYFQEYFLLFEVCCEFVYEETKGSISANKKDREKKEIRLIDEFNSVKIDSNLKDYFNKKYQFNKDEFLFNSKILTFLYRYIEVYDLRDKIIKLNNSAFEIESLSKLKDKYLITSLQNDKSVLKTFKALNLKDSKKVVIRYYDKDKEFNYVKEAQKGLEYRNVKFVNMYDFIEDKSSRYNISIEESADGEALAKLMENQIISDFKIKELIIRLIDYMQYLIEEKNIKYLPNLHPLHLFYNIEKDKLIIVCNGHNKASIDRYVIKNNIDEFKEYFQTPEFRKYTKPNLMDIIIKEISIGNQTMLDRELVYQVAMTLYYFLMKNKLPYNEENIIKEDYNIKFKRFKMRDSDKLNELLNRVLNTNPNNFDEIFDRLSLEDFKYELSNIFFNNINPFIAAGKLDYKEHQDIIIKRDKLISDVDVIGDIVENKNQTFLIQSNKRMGKSTFLSQIEHEIHEIDDLSSKDFHIIYLIVDGLQLDKEPFFYILADEIYKKIIGEDIYHHYKAPKLEKFEKQDFNSFKEYMKYIVEQSGKKIILLLDEFETAVIKLYGFYSQKNPNPYIEKYFNYDYIKNFKHLADEVKEVYSVLVSSVNFKLLKDKTERIEGFEPEALNNASEVILNPLTRDETKLLINNNKIVNDGLEFDDEFVDEIFKETNGHPFFIQYILSKVMDFKNQKQNKINRIDKSYFLNNKEIIYDRLFKEKNNNFRELWGIILTEKERKIMEAIIQNNLNYSLADTEALKVLKDSFLIKKVSSKYEVSIPIFKEWIIENHIRLIEND